ncbi:MAG: glycosyltransferase [Candidatus Anstonellales archaeon]
MKKLASIVIPTYNEEKNLPMTLKSIFGQESDYDIEVIVVDKKSTDKTAEIAQRMGCKVIEVETEGIPYARKIGMINSRGEILISASADTIYPQGWLQRVGDAIVKEGYAGVIGSIYALDGNFIENLGAEVLNLLATILNLLGLDYAAADNLVFSRRAYKKAGGFNRDIMTAEEVDIIKRLRKVGGVKYDPKAKCFVSLRRLRKWGYVKYLAFHIGNFLSSHFSGKSKEAYEAIRE